MLNMLKKNKWKWILSSILILLPSLAGVFLWDFLPEKMTLHWGISGKADGWGSPITVVVIMPLFFLLMHWVCLFVTGWDNRKNGQSRAVYGMVFWIIPILSIFCCSFLYAAALGVKFSITALLSIVIGLSFIVIGNYLPKCRPNRTIGIRLKWTLSNEENWSKTHRFAGKLWMIGGVLFMLAAFVPEKFFFAVLLILVFLMLFLSILFSWGYAQKQIRTGTAKREDFSMLKNDRKSTIIALIITAVVLLFVLIVCFTGEITVKAGTEALQIESTYSGDLSIPYESIEKIEYRETDSRGSRISGFGTPRLMMGWFSNEEFSDYIRYSYTACPSGIALTAEGEIYVISGKNEAETRALYETLLQKIAVQKDGNGERTES